MADTILGAAEMCFERFGITKTTMEDVARAAKMSRATVYRHFSDRESLIMASVTRRARMNIEPARSYIANCRTLEDKIVEGIGHNVRRGRRDPMVHLLVSPEEMTLSTQLLWRSGTAIDLTYELWAPILTEAQMLGEMRKDVDVRLLCEWIAEIEIAYISQTDGSDDALKRLQEKVRRFLVPSLVPQ
ncbi:TetR/AcrR family transcriptional regulator [Gordonia polyisoprenivorans]|uniref:TetR/AcrR family transcriptional regulator n=1 Tax=Gordonia polyisoprenivorans TaxID=84595 RepID=UPI001AD7D795|nr:TetR/AcrR family transcriptional regulator [Gordonia polyisoprenivorans]QTI70898.1 helix-turn-helix transcriptional regulator [Gordonia polyisoprenivorans]